MQIHMYMYMYVNKETYPEDICVDFIYVIQHYLPTYILHSSMQKIEIALYS